MVNTLVYEQNGYIQGRNVYFSHWNCSFETTVNICIHLIYGRHNMTWRHVRQNIP